MKTVEFKQAVEELGYFIDFETYIKELVIRSAEEYVLVSITKNTMFSLSTRYDSFEVLNDSSKERLLNIACEYAATPLDEREEPKKWTIKCPITGLYLNKDRDRDKYTWSSGREVLSYQTQFTRAEIEAFTFPTEHLIEDEVTE